MQASKPDRFAAGRIQAFGFVVGFVCLLLAGPNEVAALGWISALVVVGLTWWAYLSWWKNRSSRVPLLGLVLGMYCIYYVFGAAWGPRPLTPPALADQAFEQAALLLVVGCLALVAGFTLASKRSLRWIELPELDPRKRRYTMVVSVLLAVSALAPGVVWLLGSAGRQPLTLATRFVPLVVFALLLRRVMQRRAGNAERVAAGVIASCVVVVALGRGWMGELAALVAIFLVIYLEERRRVPVLPVVLAILYVGFFQVGKNDFRQRYWIEGYEGGYVERISYWVDASIERWSAALGGSSGGGAELAQEIVSRVSLVDQTANVLALTPDLVPYQGMKLYSYAFYTFIPRAIWPGKPSINEANRFYQWAYGIVAEGDESTSVSVGILAEGFIAFGWLGAILAMFAKGIGLGLLQSLFFSRRSSAFAVAVGVAMVPSFLSVESQFAQYFSWIAQAVFVCLAVLYPALSRRASASRRATLREELPGPIGARMR